MDITEIRIKLMDDPSDRLQAFCSITFDYSFVIRDLKIIQGTKGPFVAMPSRKLMDRCPRCSAKNQLRAKFCNDCGVRLDEERAVRDMDGRAKLYADIAHPINSGCRDMIQRRVVEAFHIEQERAKLPGYICTYDDYGEDNLARLSGEHEESLEFPATISVEEARHRREMMQRPVSHHSKVMAVSGVSRGMAFRTETTDCESFGDGLV